MTATPAKIARPRLASLELQLADTVVLARQIDGENAHMLRELEKVRTQLADALDAIHELKSQIVTKDNIIAELQELRAREGSR